MKKLIIALSIITSLPTLAAPVFIFPTCNANLGECTLTNTTNQNINCSINISGQTKKGAYVSGYDYKFLYPGMMAWVKVRSNDPFNDPIVSLRANASCNSI